ncbi:tetratricopeptide repeat protein [Paludibacterium denitrificans]|uniref:tetratricopeptide repeat protein n=1 Tax=Paludibacterium denitrificans TaxID=2675226 RepID=UPI001E5E29E6|nr:tetratricopeptide repeat protein [Paludibacterium denitrificans]
MPALECLQRVVLLQPDNPEAHNNLANTYKRLGKLEHALQSYERALVLHPNYAEVHSNLAVLLHDRGHYDEAATAARRAIDINPHLADAYLNLADIELSRLRYAEALHWLDALQVFAPQHPGSLTERARILLKAERPHESATCARQAVSAAPDHANAHNMLGQVLQALGQHEEACML